MLMDAAYAPGAAWRAGVAALFPGLPGPATTLAISPGGRNALAGLADGSIVLWEIASRQEHLREPGHTGQVNDVVFSRDGALALYAGADGQVILMGSGDRARDPALPWALRHRARRGHQPDGRMAASGGLSGESMMTPGELILWDVATGKEVRRLEGHQLASWRWPSPRTAPRCWPAPATPRSSQTAAARRQRGHRAGRGESDMLLWDVQRARCSSLHGLGRGCVQPGHQPRRTHGALQLGRQQHDPVEPGNWRGAAQLRAQQFALDSGSGGIAFLPDGHSAISCEQDGELIEWNLANGQELRRLGQRASLRTRIVVSPDGRLAMTSGMDGSLMLWDIQVGELVRRTLDMA